MEIKRARGKNPQVSVWRGSPVLGGHEKAKWPSQCKEVQRVRKRIPNPVSAASEPRGAEIV